ncbi:MAG TPA: GNAT family N-acetyltransferase [Hellea balneolensis]|uniref:GNAT family N-acetyltransferase n=1 Tax=Hellea balneolensis TaxID=287478 RepID=A0A7C3C292_9PROT|nr:GNAT family N-acetyltransferase [Hellea balneolensis]
MKNFSIRRSKRENLTLIKTLMRDSIEILQKPFLSPAQISASFEVMGLDTQLIDDGSYFCVWAHDIRMKDTLLVGCGGWSFRNTLYGGNHSKGRDAQKLDPKCDAARIRAMYTHPDWVRQGIGRLILTTCEQAARDAGFVRAEMMATLAGVPLYEKCGYTKIEQHVDITTDGSQIPLVRMGKSL